MDVSIKRQQGNSSLRESNATHWEHSFSTARGWWCSCSMATWVKWRLLLHTGWSAERENRWHPFSRTDKIWRCFQNVREIKILEADKDCLMYKGQMLWMFTLSRRSSHPNVIHHLFKTRQIPSFKTCPRCTEHFGCYTEGTDVAQWHKHPPSLLSISHRSQIHSASLVFGLCWP